MFRLFRFAFKAWFIVQLLAVAFSAGMGVAYLMQVRAQYRSWGQLRGADELGVAGDDLVPDADVIETRTIDIDAPPDKVWPWIAQLGYGRGGWYSFSALDRPWRPGGGPNGESADSILAEFQDLAAGDLVPTHPQGGFEARIVEPPEALVLYLDDTMMREQVEELVAESAGEEATEGLDLDMPPYRASWAFTLEDRPGGRTRLVERLRFAVEASEAQMKARPMLQLGVFMLMRSQMEGIKQRAEGALATDD
jgi:uncharacterized protein YndB with AHSA1/START domain